MEKWSIISAKSSRFHYEWPRYIMASRNFIMNGRDILRQVENLSYMVKFFMMAGRDFHDYRFMMTGRDFIINGWDLHNDKWRFLQWQVKILLWTVEIFMMTNRDFYDDFRLRKFRSEGEGSQSFDGQLTDNVVICLCPIHPLNIILLLSDK